MQPFLENTIFHSIGIDDKRYLFSPNYILCWVRKHSCLETTATTESRLLLFSCLFLQLPCPKDSGTYSKRTKPDAWVLLALPGPENHPDIKWGHPLSPDLSSPSQHPVQILGGQGDLSNNSQEVSVQGLTVSPKIFNHVSLSHQDKTKENTPVNSPGQSSDVYQVYMSWLKLKPT